VCARVRVYVHVYMRVCAYVFSRAFVCMRVL
jgi:hypothetical protein